MDIIIATNNAHKVEEIRTAPVRHTVQCDTDQMQAVVARILSV